MKCFSLFVAFSATSLLQDVVAQCASCSAGQQPTLSAPHKNVWRPLSADEISTVSSIVTQKLNIAENTTSNSNGATALRIDDVALLRPNKTDVLPFLDSSAREPGRYARATVLFNSTEGYYRQEYVVGPLPTISNSTNAVNSTRVERLMFPFNNKQRGKIRSPTLYATNAADAAVGLSKDIEDITRKIWNSTILEGGVAPRLGNLFWEKDGKQTLWATLLGPTSSGFDSSTVLPLGVFFHIDVTTPRWKVIGWYCRGKFYKTTEDFKKAINSPEFELPKPNVDGEWTSTDKQGDLPMDELPPPVTVAQSNSRFKIDVKENFVSWMDFKFYMAMSPDQGLSLFDIQYKGKRIMYELGLQEALAHYAGSDPQQSETLYFDTFGGMGDSMISMVKGHDCPSHAKYLDAAVPNSICIFEADANYPMRRHFALAQNYTSVARNVVFTVRWIATVGNYDYLFDYNFFYDGSIEVSVRASGYISGAYYAGNGDYGFKIHDYLSGSLHDHVMTFKADLDIYGRKNSVQKIEVVPAKVEYPWSDGKKRNTMKLEKSFLKDESESSITWSTNDAAIYAIVNRDSPNKYGEFPGYRIKRSAMASHLTVKDSTNAGKAIHFATADFFITKQKDTEPKATDWANTLDIENPLVDFSKFFDGDSLEQEDLVLWFNLGMHHVPHTGDLPNTIMVSAHSAMRLEPINYLMNEPSVQVSQQIRVNHTSSEMMNFGAKSANCSVNLSTLGLTSLMG